MAELPSGQVIGGLSQAAAAVAVCLAVALRCRRLAVHVEHETVVSLARGLAPIALISLILALALHGTLLVAVLLPLGMTVAAAVTASRRARGIPDALPVALCSIAAGSGVVIVALFAMGALTAEIATLVPVGSMIIASAMNSCAQAMERFRADVAAHSGEIETGLALGADPAVTVAPYVRSAVYAGLIPRLDSLKSLGIVWVPSVMAGLIVSGMDPISTGIFQFVVIATIFAASGVTALVATLLVRARTFSPAEQLVLRPPAVGSSELIGVEGTSKPTPGAREASHSSPARSAVAYRDDDPQVQVG